MSKIMTFPFYRQSTPFSCGAAAMKTVLRYYGHDIREDKLIKELNVSTEYGVDPSTIAHILEHNYNLKVEMREMTIDDVKSYIDKNIPVMMLIQAWSLQDDFDYSSTYEEGHYVIAIGYNDTDMIFEDPAIHGNRGRLPFDTLMDRWKGTDQGKYIGNIGMAVEGTPQYDPNQIELIE